MAVEREFPFEVLEAGEIAGDRREEVMGYLREFTPLEYVAARKAKAWLETNLEARYLPYPVHLVYSEDESQLFGFFVIHPIAVQPPPQDVVYMQVRRTVVDGAVGAKTIEDPRAATQKAMKLAWIARSEDSPTEVGEDMFDRVVEQGEIADCCAIMVEPYDDDTAERLWREHYGFVEGEGDDDDWSSCLWYALGEPDQTFG